jgi:lipopolysaccharide/colanic/teichoic acid biosynthesis glycosyltransferase/glycosyltransferase involved in cell wall biosynthesis
MDGGSFSMSGRLSENLGRPRVIHAVTASGTTRLMRGQVRYLRQAGFEVILVASPGPGIDSVAAEEGVAQAPVAMKRTIAPLQDLRSLWHLWRLVRQLRPALVNFGTAKAGLLMGIASWATGVPCRVYTVHGLRLETTRGIKRWILLRTERIACRCAHRVICVSESVRTRVLELGLARKEQAVVLAAGSFNGVDADRFAPTPERVKAGEELRRELGIPPEAPVIGFVGRVTRDKGVPELIEAFTELRRRFSELRLLWLGRLDDTDPVPETTRRFMLSDPGVVSTGYVDDSSPYYQVMDVLALPTHREGFPTVTLEASAAGKPVVTTRATGAVDAVADGITGLLVPVGDAQALTEALGSLLADPGLSRRMGRAGEERVRREFRREPIWQELAALYWGLLRERAGLPSQGVRAQTTAPVMGEGIGRHLKRLVDLCGAAVGLVVTGPLLAWTAATIRLRMGPPVLFRHRRVGREGRVFTVLKFRTMVGERDGDGRLRSKAQRITPAGRLLRRFSLDELPQLWNVLKGEMSLVGPRPLPPVYLPAYTERDRLRHAVRPGLTGWAQVHGRTELKFSRRFALDSWYVENWSLWLDLRILLLTVPRVLRPGKSADYQELAQVDDRGLAGTLRNR